jgi:hypothetical protein
MAGYNMKAINIKAKVNSKSPDKVIRLTIIAALGLHTFAGLYNTTTTRSPDVVLSGSIPETTASPASYRPPAVSSSHAGQISKIQAVYREAGAPADLVESIPWIYDECIKRGLKPDLILAVIALESGWGKSQYCKTRGNCLGYGYTDSNPAASNWEGNFKTNTKNILDAFCKTCKTGREKYCYRVDTAEQMAANGYNFHDSWPAKVRSIRSSFK